MIAGGKSPFLIPLRGSQPAVCTCRLPVPIASVWPPAERTQPGAFVCRLFIIAGLFLVFRQLPPVGVAVDLVLQLLPERLRGRRLLGVCGDGVGHIRTIGGVDSVCLRRGQIHTLGRRGFHLRSVRRHDGRCDVLQIRAVSVHQSVAPFLSAKKALELVRENQQSSAHNFVKDFSSIFPKTCCHSPLKKGTGCKNPLNMEKRRFKSCLNLCQPRFHL